MLASKPLIVTLKCAIGYYMVIEGNLFGPKREKGPGLFPAIFAGPLQVEAVRKLNIARHALKMSKEHGGPALEFLMRKRSLNEVAHDKNQFLEQYRQMNIPDPEPVVDITTGKLITGTTLISRWAQWNSKANLWAINQDKETGGITELTDWLNMILSGEIKTILRKDTPLQERAKKN